MKDHQRGARFLRRGSFARRDGAALLLFLLLTSGVVRAEAGEAATPAPTPPPVSAADAKVAPGPARPSAPTTQPVSPAAAPTTSAAPVTAGKSAPSPGPAQPSTEQPLPAGGEAKAGEVAPGSAETAGDAPGGIASQLEQLEASESAAKELRQRFQTAQGPEKELLSAQVAEADERYWRELHDLASVVAKEQPAEGAAEVQSAKREVVTRLGAEEQRITAQIDASRREMSRLSAALEKASDEERRALQVQRSELLGRLPVLYGALDAHIDAREKLGADVRSSVRALAQRLGDGAQLVGAALHGISDELRHLTSSASGELTPEQSARQADLLERRGLLAGLQKKQLALMDKRALDTAQHRQDLIRFTGEVTEDILNVEVASGLAKNLKDEVLAWLSDHALSIVFKVVSFLLILALFAGAARIARWLARRAVKGAFQMSTLASDFFVASAGRVVWGVGWIVAAAQVGIEVGPLLAGLGIAGFVLGFALQSTLSNFASGMMILVYRPFDVGDVVEAGGVLGTVSAMNLVSTAIITFDNQMLVVPNTKIWGDVIRNITHQPNRRVDLVFGIGYSDDVDHAQRILEDILAQNPRVLEEPKPVVRLHELGESSVNFVVRPWVATGDYWDAYWEITREVKRRFDAEGITIPFPQRDLHIHGLSAERQVLRSDVAPRSGEEPKAVGSGARFAARAEGAE